MPKKSPSINFVKTKKNFVDEFLKWALTIGRLVVMLTEIVALSTFLYRFILDRQLVDLRETIEQKQAIVRALSENETKYRNLQDRLLLSSQVSAVGTKQYSVFNDILKLAPNDMIIQDFTIFEEGIRVSANIQSVASLSIFTNALKNYPNIAKVSIDKIENKPSLGIVSVSLTALFKK